MALIPPFYFDCVVAIGYLDTEPEATHWVASGFLYGHRVGTGSTRTGYVVYLVTNRHVVADRERIVLRFNPACQEPAEEYVLELKGNNQQPLWCGPRQSDVDVVVVPIQYAELQRRAMQVSFALQIPASLNPSR